jgi:hypothetical protein
MRRAHETITARGVIVAICQLRDALTIPGPSRPSGKRSTESISAIAKNLKEVADRLLDSVMGLRSIRAPSRSTGRAIVIRGNLWSLIIEGDVADLLPPGLRFPVPRLRRRGAGSIYDYTGTGIVGASID